MKNNTDYLRGLKACESILNNHQKSAIERVELCKRSARFNGLRESKDFCSGFVDYISHYGRLVNLGIYCRDEVIYEWR